MLRYIVLCVVCFSIMLFNTPNAFAGWGPSPTHDWITGVPSGLPLGGSGGGIWYFKHDKDLDDAILSNKELNNLTLDDELNKAILSDKELDNLPCESSETVFGDKELNELERNSNNIKTEITCCKTTHSLKAEMIDIIHLFAFYVYLVCVIATGILLHRLVK